jgi:hypothetical protein
LAIAASTFAMETSLSLRFFCCLAASSGVTDAKAIRMASTAAICLRSLLLIFCRGKAAMLRHTEAVDVFIV